MQVYALFPAHMFDPVSRSPQWDSANKLSSKPQNCCSTAKD